VVWTKILSQTTALNCDKNKKNVI